MHDLAKPILKYTVLLISLLIFSHHHAFAQSRVIYKEESGKKSLSKNWEQVNGHWAFENDTLVGKKNKEWAVLLSKKTLPENYILTFSTLVDQKAYLFELITNLNDNHFLGILLNQLEHRVAIEDRELFPKGNSMGSYIHTKANIGRLPKVSKISEAIWINWRVQKSGNQIFIWMNDEEITLYNDTTGIVKPKGKFGFAINGAAKIKAVTLSKTRNEASNPPKNFKGRPRIRPTFSFSE